MGIAEKIGFRQGGRVSSPRTQPRVKLARVRLVSMSKENGSGFELKFKLPQLIVLIGVISGSLLCAFVIGYFSGQKVGFENALASSAVQAPRYKVEVASDNSAQESDSASEVYAKLSDSKSTSKKVQAEELPDVAEIQNAETAPVIDELVTDLLDEEVPEEPEVADSKTKDSNVTMRVLGEGAEPEKKLGDLSGSSKSAAAAKELEDQVAAKEALAKAEAAKLEAAKLEAAKLEAGKIEATKAEIARLEKAKADAAKVEKAKAEAAKKQLQAEAAADKLNTTRKPTATNTLPRGWYAQVGAPKDITDADGLAAKLRSSGFPVVIEKAEVRGDMYYRILVGPEENRQQGERMLDQVKRESYITGSPFIRMVR